MSVRNILLTCILIVSLVSPTYAASYDTTTATAIELPADLQVAVADSCSEHDIFIQAVAREDGSFAVFSYNTDIANTPELVFKRHYIDLYAPDGSFLKEIAFTCSFESTIELTESELIVWFHDKVLSYHLELDAFSYYTLPDGDFFDPELHIMRRQSKFECGDWKYECTKSLDGYVQLLRCNTSTNATEVLVDYDGTRINVKNIFLIPAAVIGLTFIFRKRIKK